MDKIKLEFYGKDFTKLSEIGNCLKKPIECPEETKEIIERNKRIILSSFMDKIGDGTNSVSDLTPSVDVPDETDYCFDDENKKIKQYYRFLGNDDMMFLSTVGLIRGPLKITLEGREYDFDISLRIGTRFDTSEKSYFLVSMLLNSDLSFVDGMIPTDNEDSMFDYLLLFRYKKLLSESFLKGFYRTYVRFEGNDDRLKGTIDFARHLKVNLGCDNGRIAYSYRENTVKNPLNYLILAAYRRLIKKFPEEMDKYFTSDYRDIITSLQGELGFNDYSDSELIKMNQKTITHPYYYSYESLRQVCLRILRDENVQVMPEEENDEINGFIAYVPALWEKFLENQFSKMGNVSFTSQDVSGIMLFGDEYTNTMRPDFVFKYDDNPYMILDAKFIPGYASVYQQKLNETEGYNKCIRDMNALGIHATGVVFPVGENIMHDNYLNPDITLHKVHKGIKGNPDRNAFDHFYTYGIVIPSVEQGKTFSEWNDLLEKQCDDVLTEIQVALEKERKYQQLVEEYNRKLAEARESME